jgi:hypothetical protein
MSSVAKQVAQETHESRYLVGRRCSLIPHLGPKAEGQHAPPLCRWPSIRGLADPIVSLLIGCRVRRFPQRLPLLARDFEVYIACDMRYSNRQTPRSMNTFSRSRRVAKRSSSESQSSPTQAKSSSTYPSQPRMSEMLTISPRDQPSILHKLH